MGCALSVLGSSALGTPVIQPAAASAHNGLSGRTAADLRR